MPPKRKTATPVLYPVGPMSYSRAKRFEECAARYKAEYVDRADRDERGKRRNVAIHLLTGSFLHEIFDRYVKHLKATKQSSDFNEMVKIFDACWVDQDLRAGIPEEMHEELFGVTLKARDMIIFENINHVVGSEISIALDKNWQKIGYDDPMAYVRMKIDLLEVDGDWVVTVTDYKTGNRIDDADESMQLKLYGSAVKALSPQASEIRVKLIYPRPDAVKEHVLTDDDIEQAKRWIAGVRGRIENAINKAEWPATPGQGCMDCPIFDSCPARALAPSEVPPVTIHEAEQLVSHYILLEAQRKRVTEKLKAWVDKNGAVVVNGLMVTYITSKSFEFPVKMLQDILKEYKLDVLNFVKADTTELKKLVRASPDIKSRLDAIGVNKSYSKFGMRRATEQED